MSNNYLSVQHQAILESWLVAELRSDHAGEIGAIFIYRGILAVTKDRNVREFAKEHLATEKLHLGLIEKYLPRQNQSRLLPIWRLAGFLTGALPSLIGPKAVFATISAVESFVVSHYKSQINQLQTQSSKVTLCEVLQSCCDDEAKHQLEAALLLREKPGLLLRNWCRLVSSGSAVAVRLTRIL